MPEPEQFTTVAECGCKFTLVAIPDGTGKVQFDMRVYQCHLHTHAKELLDSLQYALSILRLQPEPKLGEWNWPEIAKGIEETIARAKGQ